MQAFSFFPELETVSLPESLEQIGSLAFGGCPKLHRVNIPEAAAVANDAFIFDAALYSDENPFLITGGRLISYGGTTETDIVIPDGITVIEKMVFAGHSELKSVQLPDGLRTVRESAFLFCSGLSDLVLPDTLTDIGLGAFDGCTSLEKIVIPDSVTQIEAAVFADCTALRKVMLPQNLAAIGKAAFSGCTSLQEIEIPASVRSIGTDAFKDNPWLESAGDFAVLGAGILCRFQGRQKIVVIPESVKCINSDAVSGDGIVEIQIPAAVTEIAEGAISCKRAVIAGEKRSAAEQYAAANNMPFRDILAETPQGDDLTIDCRKDGWYFGNDGSVFGAEYFLSDDDMQRLKALGIDTKGVERVWTGSCVGLAITVILAKNGVFHPAELQAGAQSLSDVEPTDAVRSFINYYQCTQGWNGSVTGMTEYQKIYQMSLDLPNVKHGESPYLLTFVTGDTSHGVAAYGLESGSWSFGRGTYDRRILVWDSNFPDALHDDSCLYFNSLTLDYCIPQYSIHVADGADNNTAGLIDARNDLAVLNAYPYPLPDAAPGDVNFDGSVTIADAVLLCRYLTAQTELTDRARRAADLSGDREINAADLTLLKQKLFS